MTDLEALERKARAVPNTRRGRDIVFGSKGVADLYSHATPDVILELIAEIRRLRGALEQITKPNTSEYSASVHYASLARAALNPPVTKEIDGVTTINGEPVNISDRD